MKLRIPLHFKLWGTWRTSELGEHDGRGEHGGRGERGGRVNVWTW